MLTLVAFADYGSNRKRGVPDSRIPNWRRVVHADVKPSNIFLRRKYETGTLPSLVLGDFGQAFLGASHESGGATPMFHGPEYPFVSAKTDIWEIGVIIHLLANGWVPMIPRSEKGLARVDALSKAERIQAKEAGAMTKSRKLMRLDKKKYSEELNSCMLRCLEPDPRVRITSDELVEMLWTRRGMWKRREEQREREEDMKEAQEREKARAKIDRQEKDRDKREREEQKLVAQEQKRQREKKREEQTHEPEPPKQKRRERKEPV